MATKRKIQVSEVVAGNRTLEAVLIDMAERIAQSNARADERSAQADARIAAAEERIAAAEERIAVATAEIQGISAGIFGLATRMDARLRALESRAA
jgi:hypothetical protein